MFWSKLASTLLLCTLYWIVSAASFSGFIGKWSLMEWNSWGIGIVQILDGSAKRPFIYRQLFPMLARTAYEITPTSTREIIVDKIKPRNTFARVAIINNEEVKFEYIFVYYSCFFAIFFSLFVLRLILLSAGIGNVAATMAPILFALSLPYLQTMGGYFYDYTELFFLSTCIFLAMRGRLLLLAVLAIPATLNKETFIFFIPTIYPFIRANASRTSTIFTLGALGFLSSVVNIIVKIWFSGLPGGVADLQLFNNIKNYLTPSMYFQIEVTYGIVSPKGASFISIMIALIVLIRGWNILPNTVSQHILIATAITAPLFFIFCATGELRNLSFLYIGFTFIIAIYLNSLNISKTAANVAH
jgi:hypothetical protein